MNKPSVKTLERAFPGKGKILRQLLTSEKAVRAHPAVIKLDRQCYNTPTLAHLRMTALDAELECHGVEYVQAGHDTRSPAFEYCNTGDTYSVTIVRFNDGRYAVTDIGAIIERGRYD